MEGGFRERPSIGDKCGNIKHHEKKGFISRKKAGKFQAESIIAHLMYV